MMLLLVGQLSYLQVYEAHRLSNDPRNFRALIRDFVRPRGEIVTADGQIVARSIKTNDELTFQRQYPLGPLFAQIAGVQSFVFGNTGIERTYNNELAGRDPALQLHNLPDILAERENTGNVVLSIRASLQQAAAQELGDSPGSIIVMDPRTGAILAMYSHPSFDPGPLAGHDTKDVQQYGQALGANPDKPDLPRAYRERYPPGSTFKVVTAAVALDAGLVTPDTEFPVRSSLALPQTTGTLMSFGGEPCGGTLANSLTVSCNPTFGDVGLQLGDQFVPGMQRFGIDSAPPLDIAPGAAPSAGPSAGSFQHNKPLFAFAGIGQGDVAVTPLQMALVACAVANNGVIMQPHGVDKITDTAGHTIKTTAPKPWRTATSPQTAAALKQMMISVVQAGTGTLAQADIPGVTVAGKTGTAQNPTGFAHAWFIALAPADNPQVVVAVLVEHGGSTNSETTGGRLAAPIAAHMIAHALTK